MVQFCSLRKKPDRAAAFSYPLRNLRLSKRYNIMKAMKATIDRPDGMNPAGAGSAQ